MNERNVVKKSQQNTVVLVVDDSEEFQIALQRYFEGLDLGVTIVSALTTDEGKRLFEERNPAVVAMDGNIPGSIPSLRLVQMMRGAGFKGPLVAISSFPDVRKKFLEFGEMGCDRECEKTRLHTFLVELLGIPH